MKSLISPKELKQINTQISPIEKEAEGIDIATDGDVAKASFVLKKVSDLLRNIEAKRLEFTQPLNQSLKAINSTFNELKRPLNESKAQINFKILTWRREEQARIAKEEERRRKIQEAHAKRGNEVKAPVVMDRPEKTIAHAQTKKVWKFKVTRFGEVPDEFKLVNETLVRSAMFNALGETKKPPKIKGLKFYQEEVMSVV